MVDWSKVPPQDRRLKPKHVTGRIDLGDLGVVHGFGYPVRTNSASAYLQHLLRELLDLWRKEVERILGDLPPEVTPLILGHVKALVQYPGRTVVPAKEMLKTLTEDPIAQEEFGDSLPKPWLIACDTCGEYKVPRGYPSQTTCSACKKEPASVYDKWSTVRDMEDARERILSGWGVKEGPLPSDVGLIGQVGKAGGWGGTVLDFGCGIGRNILPLAAVNEAVVGYDFPNMLTLLREYLGSMPGNVRLESSWGTVLPERFDAVYASLIFQHLLPKDVRTYLKGLAGMSPNLYVHTRVTSDFDGIKMFDLLTETWEVATLFKWERVQCVEDLAKLDASDHYAMHLRPR